MRKNKFQCISVLKIIWIFFHRLMNSLALIPKFICMKFSSYVFLLICCVIVSCKLMHPNRAIRDNRAFGRVLKDYYNDRMRYFPVEATQNGDNRYNDQLPIDFTDSYQDTLRNFYGIYLHKILAFDRERFNQNDQISYDILLRELKMDLEGIDL